jgi:single-strand DNA-binding protein
MTIYASIHGRAGQDPTRSTTQNGKDMTRLSIVADVAGWNAEDDESLWVSVLAFGRAAEDLARAGKGQMVTAQGKLTRGHYTGKDGAERESWTLTADAVLVAASAKPTGKARSQEDGPQRQRTRERAEPAPFDDEIPF